MVDIGLIKVFEYYLLTVFINWFDGSNDYWHCIYRKHFQVTQLSFKLSCFFQCLLILLFFQNLCLKLLSNFIFTEVLKYRQIFIRKWFLNQPSLLMLHKLIHDLLIRLRIITIKIMPTTSPQFNQSCLLSLKLPEVMLSSQCSDL